MADDEKSSLMSEQSLKDSVSKNSSKTEINGEKAYDVVANLSEDDLRDFLKCVTTGNKDSTNNKTSTIAQILLERETAVLREESGSGDDSPDSSKQNQFLRSKPRHSSARLLHNRYGSQSSHRIPSSCSFDSHYGKTSAAARNTAGSLGSLHDLSNSDARSSNASSASQHASSHASSSKGSHGGGASKCCATRGAGQEECVGVSRPPPLRTYSRVRTGGSCGNLSRSSFDTQPPGRGKRSRRSKGADPASTSTREGGSLQNLSKAEGCGEEEQKGLQKSGSLSQVFTEETTPPKHKSRRRKASSETQQSHQRASEERSVGAPDSFSSDDEDESHATYPPYRPLSPHHSPLVGRRDAAGVIPAPGGISSEHSGCASRASSISSHDETMSVQVEEMRRSAFTTTAATAAADGAAVDAAAAAACLGAAVSARPAHHDQGEELLEVVSHTAHSDTVKSSWLPSSSPSSSRNMGGRRRSTSPHSAAVDSPVPYFSRSSSDRHSDSAGKNSYGRSHSIESNAYLNERGSEREKLQSQRSEPSQLGRRKDSAIDCPSPPSHSYSTSGSPHCTFSVSGGAGSSLIVSPGDHRDHGLGRTPRFKPGRVKKKRQQEVQTVDTSAPSYKGDQDIGSILLYLGEESADVSAGDNKKKKKKQDSAPNKKDDKKESGKKGSSGDTSSKKADDGKDDHKKEDSGGGGSVNNNEKKKKHKEDRKNSTPLTEEDELGVRKMKKEVIEKELKKNGIITAPSSLDSSVVSGVGATGTGGDGNKSSLEGNSLDCDNTSSVRTNVESSKTLTSVSDKESKTSVRKHPDDKAGPETSNRSSSKKTDKQNASITNSEAPPVSKRSKKGGKENQGMRASSSVEDLVSKCRMSEQMSQGSKQTTVDDGAMTKKRQQKNSRRNAAESGLPATSSSASNTTTAAFKDSSTKDKHRRTVDDIRVKSASGASKSSGGSSSLSNSKKLSKRLSSSNSNLNSTTKSSEFGRDFYEAGDPYNEGLPLKGVAVSDTNDEFELVTRRKNRNKKFSPASGNSSLIPGSGKLRYADENFSRDGYRELAHHKNASSRSHHNSSSSNSVTKAVGGGSSHINPSSYSSHSTDGYPSKGISGGKKPPINFDEAPRTPHDGNFMARLSANNSNDRNTATSAPNSDCSDSDGDDSVHSMPTPSTTPRPEVRKPPSSSGATPQTSYANIARLAGTANRNQVKRMTSAPQPGRTAAAAGASTTSTSSNSTSGGYSAAACATSDQSLLTTNAWPCLSSVGGAAATVANSGAATSAPAIPSVVRWASGSSGRQSDPQYAAPTFGSPPRLTSAAIAAHDAKPQNILHDNFPPLKTPSYSCSFNHRQASIESDTGLAHASHHVDTHGKCDDVSVRMTAEPRAGPAASGRASFSSDKESSPLADRNISSVPVDRSASNKAARSGVVSATVDIPEKKSSKENRNNRTSPPNRTMNGHENLDQTSVELTPGNEGTACPERLVKQAVCNMDHMKGTHAVFPTTTSLNSSMPNASIQVDKTRTSKALNKSKDAKRRQYDPVVFADSLQLDDIRNSNLTFMFASNEDLTDVVVSGPNVTANNLVNSTVSLMKTGSKITAAVDSNGNPVIRARKSTSGDEVDTSLSNLGDPRKKSRDSSCSSNCTIIDATSSSVISATESCSDCAAASVPENVDASSLVPEARSLKVNTHSPSGNQDLCLTCAPDLSHWGVTFHAPDADDPAWNFTEAVSFIRNNWKKIERALHEGDSSIVTLDLNSLHSQ